MAALERMRAARLSQRSTSQPSETSGSQTRESAESMTREGGLDVDGVLATLKAQGWGVHAAARALGVPKTTLYRFIEAHGLVRKAGDIPDAELRAVHARCGGDRQAMSDQLRISTRALTFRLKALEPQLEVH